MSKLINISGFIALCGAAMLASAPAAAQSETCTFRAPGWTNPAGERIPAGKSKAVRLVRIGLNTDGSYKVRTADKHLWPWSGTFEKHLPELITATNSSTPVTRPGGSPLDLTFKKDTEIVFMIDPDAWNWEADAVNVFFLKPRTRGGLDQPHNPFGVARPVAGNDRLRVVRYDPIRQYRNCTYDYNLGVVVTQPGGGATPTVIDPRIENGGNT